MRIEHGARACQAVTAAEMNRLRELHDWPIRKIPNHRLAKPLMPLPQVAEITASVDENHTIVGERLRDGGAVVGLDVTPVVDAYARRGEPCDLAKPDSVVANVGMVGKIDEDAVGPASHEGVERCLNPLTQTLDERRFSDSSFVVRLSFRIGGSGRERRTHGSSG